MDEDDLPFAEPVRELPREVRGILVLVKGKKTKKSIQWRPESSLVEVNYFEMDDTERANVFKLKSFEEMRKQELARYFSIIFLLPGKLLRSSNQIYMIIFAQGEAGRHRDEGVADGGGGGKGGE